MTPVKPRKKKTPSCEYSDFSSAVEYQETTERVTIVERDLVALGGRISEFFTRLEKTVDRLQTATNDLTNSSSRTDGRFTALDVSLEDLKERQNSMKADQDRFERSVTGQFETFRTDLIAQFTKPMDKTVEDVEQLESRIRALENFKFKVTGIVIVVAAIAGKLLSAGWDWTIAKIWH